MSRKIFQILILLLASLLFTGCTSLILKPKIKKNDQIRLGVVTFKITAPIKKLKEIKTFETNEPQLDLVAELAEREDAAKQFFIGYMERYKDIQSINIPSSELPWKEDMKFSKQDLIRLKDKYELDALILGEVPWYGKTNIIYPIIGLTTDVLAESIIIGLVTKWNWPIILGNVGLELVTNTPLWFGGAYLFGYAFKPVTLETRLYVFTNKVEDYGETFEATRARHMLEKYPKADRKKKQYQFEASFRKVLKELAVELGEK